MSRAENGWSDGGSSEDSPVNRVVRDYYRMIEQGGQITPEQLILEHPELEDELRRYFLADELVDQALGASTDRIGDAETIPHALVDIRGYEIKRRIGAGGMGVVYQAYQRSLKRNVALKIALSSIVSLQGRERFRIECEAVARLQHRNVIEIFDVGEHGGIPYFTMEMMDGGSLSSRIDGRKMPQEEAAELVQTLAQAIHYCHENQVTHRDLKPSNVLFTKEHVPKISDFGLAKMLDLDESDGSGITRDDALLGTPDYMAPEQARGASDEVGALTDVHALGVILYRLLSGKPPFQGKTKIATLERVRTQRAVPPSRYDSDVNADLEAICLKCLEKDPESRYASGRALADDLGRWLSGETPAARREFAARQRAKLVRRACAVALLCFVVVAGFAVRARYFSDEASLRRIHNRLGEGERVTLVGGLGMPAWHQLAGETAEAVLWEAPEGSCSLSAPGVTCLLLVDDPQLHEYRVRAELRHDQTGDRDALAGIVVAHQTSSFGLQSLMTCCVFGFNEVNMEQLSPFAATRAAREGDLPRHAENSLRLFPFLRTIPGQPHLLDQKLAGPEQRFEVTMPRQWRTIEIDVRQDAITARWESRPNVMRLDSTTAERDVQKYVLAARVARGMPAPPPNRDYINHRGGLGVFVQKGTVSFRNVTIEPLEPLEPLPP